MSLRTVKKVPIMWVPVYTPDVLGSKEVVEIATKDIEKVVGRTVEISLYDVTKDIEHQFTKIKLKIVRVEDGKAYTVFVMHDTTRDYIRSLVRKGTSRVDLITDVKTKDNYVVRIFVMAITMMRVSTSKEHQIRKVMLEVLNEHVKQITFDELVKEMLFGKLVSLLNPSVRKIYPCKYIGVIKSKLIQRESIA